MCDDDDDDTISVVDGRGEHAFFHVMGIAAVRYSAYLERRGGSFNLVGRAARYATT